MNRFTLAMRGCALTLLGLFAEPALAQTLYGLSTSAGIHNLITINTVTGVGTLVGPVPIAPADSPSGIAFRGNKLYVFAQFSAKAFEINPATGAMVTPSINLGLTPPVFEGDFAFRPSDGQAFIAATSGELYQADITANTSFLVGKLASPIDGLAFDGAGTLFGLREMGTNLYKINQASAALTLVGPTGIAGAFINGVGALAYDGAGKLYACVAFGSIAGPCTLYSIDPATGTATLIGPIGFSGVVGLRFGLPPAVSVAESGGATSVTEGGGTDTYTVALDSVPTANVTITLNPGTQVTVVPATLTFTPANWNVAQTVTVTAVDDALVEGPHIGTITHTSASGDAAYNLIAIANVTANITDNDGSPPPTPGGGIAEGSYAGSKGLANGNGGEGTFGFGRQLRTLHPFLKGPHRDPHGTHRVFNVAHQQPALAAETDSGLGVVGWGFLSLAVLVPAVWVYGRRRPA